ncbi:Crp/Fnr family transcriptional regulator [Chitinophaga varians]|uniref:Crp/Fnr family transcriptional regulator n=1 Tax=Chitinophaga varians TaxID=2202339 RepID=A0A847RRE5_9BACT|nr:Crp/Fnr family transcriptional regulator [Chitinophaga varians]NLR64314.1 Crp/Fnr family transcriptional regulator [Chitinophaga varians]
MHQQVIYAIENIIPLDAAEKEFVASLFQLKRYNREDYFLREGQVCRAVGFINHGLIRYYATNTNGEEQIYDFGRENDFFCNYSSFLDHSPSASNIQFMEDSEVLLISHEDLQRLYSSIKHGERFGRLACEQLYVHAIKKIASLYADSPEQRYLRFQEDYPDLQQRIPQYYVSSFVGVKPPSLSRIRKRMASRQIY